MNVLMKFVISIILSFAFSFFEYDDMHPVTRGEFLRCPNCANPQMQVRYQLLSSVNFRGIDNCEPNHAYKIPYTNTNKHRLVLWLHCWLSLRFTVQGGVHVWFFHLQRFEIVIYIAYCHSYLWLLTLYSMEHLALRWYMGCIVIITTVFNTFTFLLGFEATCCCLCALFNNLGTGSGDITSQTSCFHLLLQFMAGVDWSCCNQNFTGEALSTGIRESLWNLRYSANLLHFGPQFFWPHLSLPVLWVQQQD